LAAVRLSNDLRTKAKVQSLYEIVAEQTEKLQACAGRMEGNITTELIRKKLYAVQV
jgi:hypothetical protein